jgi:hypothetical protein
MLFRGQVSVRGAGSTGKQQERAYPRRRHRLPYRTATSEVACPRRALHAAGFAPRLAPHWSPSPTAGAVSRRVVRGHVARHAQLRQDGAGQLLALFEAPLVIRVHVPDDPLDEDLLP